MKDNNSVGITKTKKHSIIIRFDLTKQSDQEGLRHFLGKPQMFTIIQIKEFPEHKIAYVSDTDLFKTKEEVAKHLMTLVAERIADQLKELEDLETGGAKDELCF